MTDAPAVIINLPGYPFDNLTSVATVAALRALDSSINANGDNIAVDGGAAIGDGAGGLYTWAAASMATDNGSSVIRPTDVAALSAGRWILTGNSIFSSIIGVTPEQYGAIGNGAVDDTTALLAALATGFDVRLTSGKTYKFTAALSLTANYQRLGGTGVLAPAGSFDAVKISGGLTGCELDLTFNAPLHTGTAVRIDNASRIRIRKLLGVDVASVLYVQSANTVTVEWLWATARGKGITWFGDSTHRSDVLNIQFALIGMTNGTTEYGFDWDGNCNSLSIKYLGIVNGYGAIIRNTSGASPPAIGRFDHIEVDFSDSHAIDVQTGSDYDFNLTYALGATGSGIRIGSGINSDEVRIAGGKFRGNTRYGIENLSAGEVLISGAIDLNSNALGPTFGTIVTPSPRFQIDGTAFWTLTTGNPVFAFDADDYLGYDRTSNIVAFFIAAAAQFGISATAATLYAKILAPALKASTSYANDAAAAAGGVALGEFYRNGSVVQIRVA
jgi:hypothetical protein